jgi:hypothetical protein
VYSGLLNTAQNLPVRDEESDDTPNPGWHAWLAKDKEDIPTIGAVIEAFRLSVLPQHLTTMRADAYHGLTFGDQ